MLRVVILQFLAGSLSLGIFVIILLVLIQSVRWVRRTKHAIASYSDVDEWLEIEPQLKAAGAERRTLRKMGIWSLQNLSSRKRKLVITFILTFILFFAWLVWETLPYRFIDRSVYVRNDDTRVFFVADVDYTDQMIMVQGAQTPFLDLRRCIVSYLVPYTPNISRSRPIVSANWNLTCRLEAGIIGYASLSVEYYIYINSDGASEIMNLPLYTLSVQNGVLENETTRYTQAEFPYTCYDSFDYYIGVVLDVHLSGFSSVRGIDVNTPACLSVYNISIADSF